MNNNQAKSFLPIRLNTLKEKYQLSFDVYIKLPSKYLRYVNNGDTIDLTRIESLKKKKVKKLFIQDKDEDNYQQFLDQCLDDTINDKNLTSDQKADVILSTSEDTTDDIYDRPVEEKSYTKAEKTSKVLLDVLSSDDKMLSSILLKKSEDEDNDYVSKIKRHSINSSSLAIKFAAFLNLNDQKKANLGIAALYHDIGFTCYEKENQTLFFKSYEDMTSQEKILYHAHPQKGHDLLNDKEFISQDILNLILTHEERLSGQGFPNKLSKLSVEQEIHALTCLFDYRVTCLGEDISSVMKNIMVDELSKFNLEVLQKFKKFLSIELSSLK